MRRVFVGLLLICALTLTGCKKEKKADGLGLSAQGVEDTFKGHVAEVTSGRVSVKTRVAIRFAHMVTGAVPGRAANPKAFSLTPPTGGQLTWSSESTLMFEPFFPLPTGTTFRGTLQLADLSQEFKNLPPFSFSFSTQVNEVDDLTMEWQPASPGSPEKVLLLIRLSLAKPETLEALKQSITFNSAGKESIDLSIRQEGDKPQYVLTSSAISRPQGEATYQLIIAKGLLGIDADFVTAIALQPPQKMMLESMKLIEDESTLGAEFVFNEPLKESGDYKAYVQLEPKVEVNVSARGKSLIIVGPFSRQTKYTCTLQPKLTNIWGGATDTPVSQTIRFADVKPAVKFSEEGAFLPTTLDQKLAFKTMNLKKVHLSVHRVFTSNLGQFLQVNDLRDKSEGYFTDLPRVGEEIAATDLVINNLKDRWQQHQLELDQLFLKAPRGLLLVHLSFQRQDIDYTCANQGENKTSGEGEEGEEGESYYHRDYYDDPCQAGYYYRDHMGYKPVIISDIGLLAAQDNEKLTVYATNVLTARPLAGVKVTLYSYQNQVVGTNTTDAEGKTVFNQKGYYLVGEKDEHKSVVKFNSDRLSMDAFPASGVVYSTSTQGIQTYLYAERGVFRPGDPIYLTGILRQGVEQLPFTLPVRLKVFTPLKQQVVDEVNGKSLDGMLSWTIPTKVQDPTGLWEARVFIGENAVGVYPFRVETIAPPRIKVVVNPNQPSYTARDKKIELKLASEYLFGAPAADLKYNLRAEISSYKPAFQEFGKFTFFDEAKRLKPDMQQVSEATLDGQGRASASFSIPSYTDIPSGLKITFRAEVIEEGGRPVNANSTVLFHPFPAYVGIDHSGFEYCRTQTNQAIPVVLVDVAGKPVAGKKLVAKIYNNHEYWWWDFGAQTDDFYIRFKSDFRTTLAQTIELTSGATPQNLNFTPTDDGQYLIEVKDEEGGHEAGFFVYASRWGGPAQGKKGGATLGIQADKQLYAPGDTARLTLKTPDTGSLLLAVVKGDVLVSSRWQQLSSTTTSISLAITSDMTPNVYVFAAAIQPHAQTKNDRPLRAYGVLPLAVEDAKSRLDLTLSAPEEIRPNSDVTVKIQTGDQKSATITIALVDEGLLSLTDYKSPDPWGFFYRKLALGVSFFDIFDNIIGATKGPIVQTFRVGGDLAEGRGKRLNPVEINRFPPVALFWGPISLDAKGEGHVTFHVPNYMGQVRIMAAGCRGKAYGSAEKFVRVKEDVVILSTLPRVIGPGETFEMPVNMFATKDNIGEVTLAIETNEFLTVEGEQTRSLSFVAKEEKSTVFNLKAAEKIGIAEVRLVARWRGGEVKEKTSFSLRPVYPYITKSETKAMAAHSTLKIDIPVLGMEGTRSATLNLWRIKPPAIGQRLAWLIRYPYGCVEQTTSAVFPQIFLKPIIAASPDIRERERLANEIDININAAIVKYMSFAMPDGAFSYWPGTGHRAEEWLNLYVGHFLIEARKQGYHVPFILDKWLQFEKNLAASPSGDWRLKTYRLYLLALAGLPDVSAMNLILENDLGRLGTIPRYFLSGAYKLAGSDEIAMKIRRTLAADAPGRDSEDYWSFGGALGDQGIVLMVATDFKAIDQAVDIANRISTTLESSYWYNTHSLSWALLGLGKHIQATWKKESVLQGAVGLPDGTQIPFSTDEIKISIPVDAAIGKSVWVRTDSDVGGFVELVWGGIPTEPPFTVEQKGIKVSAEFFDEKGQPLDVSKLPQGTSFFAHFTVQVPAHLEYVALTQIFPSGWEIASLRTTGEALPEWTTRFPKNEAISYQDVRDDRIHWFLDKTNAYSDYHFFAKLVTVTKGTFNFAPTYAEAMYDHNFFAYLANGKVEVR